ncbi:hypothetical protein [Klebsiella pneumoniae]|uniref:hypothetical protein n=1 Tax=Klebsiella pneumoniae TaxID=573 RepID=UPI0022CDC5B3|nr:hypothetical protein [Klebsiella pneumoniae]
MHAPAARRSRTTVAGFARADGQGTSTCLELRVLADRRGRSGPSGGLVVAVFIESWGETVLRPDLYANADYYLLQPANLFGIARCAGGLAVGIVLARLLAFLLLDGHLRLLTRR